MNVEQFTDYVNHAYKSPTNQFVELDLLPMRYLMIEGNKAKWHWRVMVLCADFMPVAVIDDAIAQVETKLGPSPFKAKLDYLEEGKCIQYFHHGDYGDVAKVCEKFYGEYLSANGLKPNGYYHEIYLNDPTREAPKKRKIIIRQPVKQEN